MRSRGVWIFWDSEGTLRRRGGDDSGVSLSRSLVGEGRVIIGVWERRGRLDWRFVDIVRMTWWWMDIGNMGGCGVRDAECESRLMKVPLARICDSGGGAGCLYITAEMKVGA